MRYSVDALLTHMRSGPSINGWNAIVAYDRLKANKVLAQEYIERFSQEGGYLPKLTGEVPTTENEVEFIYDYLMDAPRLSFENSEITSAKASLTMRVLGGSQFTIGTETGRGAAVSRVAEYDALQAIPHTMNIDLTLTEGVIEEGGRVVLDLKQGYVPLLYFGPTRRQREKGGDYILNRFKEMTPIITTFTLNEIGSQEGQFLKVGYFDIRTHKEPGATVAHAQNYGEGEVLMFITMEGEENGTFPATDEDLKFLIPEGDYSSATYLGQRFLVRRIFVEGLKDMAAGSPFAYKLNGPVDGFVEDVEVTQGNHQGAERRFNSPSFSSIALSGFMLPMMGMENFSLSVVEGSEGDDGLLQIEWSGSAEQGCSITPLNGSPRPGSLIASWRFSLQFKFVLMGDDGELSLNPIPESESVRLKITPGTFHDWPSMPFAEVTNAVEPGLYEELTACMEQFASVVTRIDAFRLNNLLFKGANVVRFTRTDFPGDLVMFGKLAPEMDYFDIDPLEHTIGAGDSYTFTVTTNQSVTWEVEKIEGYTGYAGQITSSGVYTAPVKSELEEHGLHFIRARIKARGTGAGVAYALVTVVTRAISINPLVMTCNASTLSNPQKREVAAGALARGELLWEVAGNTGSTIEPSLIEGGDHTYTAPLKSDDPDMADVAYTLEEIVVTDSGGARQSSWVLVVHSELVGEIKIVENPNLAAGQIQFVFESQDQPFPGTVWACLKGSGEINPDTGVYTSDAHGAYRFALITATAPSPHPAWPDANAHFILPLPVIDLPILLDALAKSNKYFNAVPSVGMDEAARLAGF